MGDSFIYQRIREQLIEEGGKMSFKHSPPNNTLPLLTLIEFSSLIDSQIHHFEPAFQSTSFNKHTFNLTI